MSLVPKILAPIDLSENSPRAVRYAVRLAYHCHSELTLLHVDSSEYKSSFFDPAISELSEAWRNRAEKLLTKFLSDESLTISVRRVVLPGKAASKIIEFAHSEHASLVVIATHGNGLFRPSVLGSTAIKVLDSANCPVLTGIHSPIAFPDECATFRRILCAVDFGPHSANTLAWASHFANEFDAQLTIAHITPSTSGGVGEYFNPERHGYWASEARQEEFASQAREKLARAQKSAGMSATVFIDTSIDVPKAVCSAATKFQADLLVVGRGSSAGIDRLRTKVYSIIRQSPCPVVSV